MSWSRLLVLLCLFVAPLWHGSAGAMLAKIEGRVVENGLPVPGAIVELGGNFAVADARGHFFLGLPPGEYEVTVAVPDRSGAQYRASVTVDAEGVLELDLRSFERVFDRVVGDTWYARIGTYAIPSEARDDWLQAAPILAQAGWSASIYLEGGGRVALAVRAEAGEAEAEEIVAALRRNGPGQVEAYGTGLWNQPLVEEPAEDLDEAAITSLIELLEDEREEVRRSARSALAAIGQPAVEDLIASIGDRNYRRDLGAIFALGAMASWSAPSVEVAKVWKVASSYDDATMDAAFQRAMQALAVQDKLHFLGFSSAREFQAKERLVVDGIVGPATLNSINRVLDERLR